MRGIAEAIDPPKGKTLRGGGHDSTVLSARGGRRRSIPLPTGAGTAGSSRTTSSRAPAPTSPSTARCTRSGPGGCALRSSCVTVAPVSLCVCGHAT